MADLLFKQLCDYVDKLSGNGIMQHSPEWDEAKVSTIGGSQISTVIGKNPYSSIFKMLSEKVGISKFRSDIKVQWGNLFERLIKEYVQIDKKTTIIGSDIFIPGPAGTSYSPDGLGVLYKDISHMRALFEFKCPQTRLLNGKVPDYYIPQVKFGLDIVDCVDIGVFIEGVFRRCSWGDLNNTPAHDKTLVSNYTAGNNPLAFGIIGFYFDANHYEYMIENNDIPRKYSAKDVAIRFNTLKKYYCEVFEVGDKSNNYMSNDLGDCDPKLFINVMHSFDVGILQLWYSDIFIANGSNYDAIVAMNRALEKFEAECRSNGHINYGILPWKLFKVDYHYIEKDIGFVERYRPQIDEILSVVRECIQPENREKKIAIYESFVQSKTGGGFE